MLGDCSSPEYPAENNPELAQAARAAIPVLIAALGARSADLRANAADALGKFGAEASAALPALAIAQDDPHALVRQAARMAVRLIE